MRFPLWKFTQVNGTLSSKKFVQQPATKTERKANNNKCVEKVQIRWARAIKLTEDERNGQPYFMATGNGK